MYKHLNCVADHNFIPEVAFLFKPHFSQDPDMFDDFKRYEGQKFRRLLFEGWAQGTYTPEQIAKLDQFEKYIKEKGIVLDERWDRPWRLRFLLSTNYVFQKTVEDMAVFMNYMGKVEHLSFTSNVAKNLRQGLFYIVGRDSHFRPILVFDAIKIIQSGVTEEQLMETQVYFFQYVMRHCFIPGQVESWVALIDSAYQGFFSLIGALQNSFEFLANTYRMRLYCCYNVRINFPIRLVWGIVQKFLDQQTVNKIHLVQDRIPEQLFQFCNRSQVEQKFGGTMPDIEEGKFWPPPVEVSPNYSVQTHPVAMMTKEQYTQLHKTNVLYDTKIHEQLLIREPSQMRQNEQKKVIKHLEKQFERELEEVQEQTIDLPKVLGVLTKKTEALNYFDLLKKDKELSNQKFKE